MRFLLALSLATAALAQSCCVQSYSASTDYYPNKVVANYATGWSVAYYNSYKVVSAKILNSETNVYYNQTYVLYKCGTPIPTQNFTNDAKFIKTPVQKVAVDGSTSGTFLEFLRVRDLIANISTSVSSPCLEYDQENGISGDFNSSASDADKAKFDLIISNSIPQYLYGSPDPFVLSNTIADWSTTESSMLGRLEWIEYFSTFFDLEKSASSYAESAYSKIQQINQTAQTLGKKNCSWLGWYLGYYDDTPGTYLVDATNGYLPVAGCNFIGVNATLLSSDAEYRNNYLCSLDVLFLELYTPVVPVFISQIYNAWLNESASCHIFTNKQVFNLDRRIDSQNNTMWFEDAIARGDDVALEFLAIIHSNVSLDLTKNFQRQFFREITTENPIVLNSSMCTATDIASANVASGLKGCAASTESAASQIYTPWLGMGLLLLLSWNL